MNGKCQKRPIMSRQDVAHWRHDVFTRSQCHCGRSNTVTLLRERKLGKFGPSVDGLVTNMTTAICKVAVELGESC